jgi:Carboxypeptidase regulatory-like domain
MAKVSKASRYCLYSVTALLLSFSSSALAQQVFGSIYGTVTDPSGSAVNNAKVTITDISKGTSFDVMTNESGIYQKQQLIPDAYKVTIEAPGFSKVVSTEIVVQVDQASRFDAALAVGNVQQQVEVTAAAPLLQTDRADVAQTFTSQEISQLPSIGRNLQSFELLNPGTVKLGWQHAADENPQGSIQTIVNGQLFDSTGYFLDGTINQDPILGIIVINPTFDSVNEVKQANQDYDAEFGYTGAGIMTYSTKSGSNTFHGDGFEYLFLNTPGFQDFGRNPFNAAEANGAPTTRQNQYGGSIGGRIIKDKLFFFGDAQLTRNTKGGSVLTTVPTAQNRTGDLSDWLRASPNYPACLTSGVGGTNACQYQAYDPNTGDQTTGVGRTPFANNQIPISRLSPQALALANYFPLPNTAASGGVPYNNYSSSGAVTIVGNQWDTRWDYYGNEKNSYFGRYSYAQYSLGAPGAFGALAGGPAFSNANYAGASETLNQSIAGGWTHTFNPTLINEFRFGYMRYHITDVPNGFGTTPATAAGIPGLNVDNNFTSGLPAFYVQQDTGGINNQSNATLGYSLGANQCNCPLEQREQQYQFVDNISKTKGNHTFKVGADIRYALNLRVPSDSHRAGEVYFQPGGTGLVTTVGGSPQYGLAMASFLLGTVTRFERYVSSSTNAQERQKRLFWYGQDSWHATPKLTLTYGLRWEWVFPETVNAIGNGAELDVNTGQMDVFGVGLVSNHGYQSMNWHNFAPRLSVAYQITPKTVIRAGYGWSYSLGTFGSTFGHNVTQNPPVLARQLLTQQSSCENNFCDVFTLGSGGNGLAVGPPAFDPANYQGSSYVPGPNGTFKWPGTTIAAKTRPGTFTMPVVYAYNFTIQRQLTNRISVSGGYVGNQGRHTPLGTDMSFNMNQQFFLPNSTPAQQATAYPFAGLYGPRYNYGWLGEVDNYCNCANNRYDSFQALFKVNALAGYTLTGNYTYQRVQGDGWGGNNSYTFLYDRGLGYGQSPYMPHQSWVLAQNYDIPFGRGRHFGANSNRFVDAFLGGWNLSAIYTYYSGIPFQPSISNYGSGIKPYTGPNDRPDVGTGSPYAPQHNRNAWILPLSSGAYTLPASNTFGNYPINSLYGPYFNNLDASLMKQFSITERLKFMLRLDTTNTLNHTNLDNPQNNIQSGNAGQITQTAQGGNYQMRRIQYSGTITF